MGARATHHWFDFLANPERFMAFSRWAAPALGALAAALGASFPEALVRHGIRNGAEVEVPTAEFVKAFHKGVERNTPAAQQAGLAERMARFDALIQPLGKVRKGDLVNLDSVPGQGMQLSLNGKALGAAIPGDDFYDALLRIFASDRVAAIMDRLKMPDGEAIEHPWVTRSIENAQRKVEARNFDMRKHLLEYDDVANDQRKVIYQQRNELLESTDISVTITAMCTDVVSAHLATHVPPGSLEEQWDIPGLETVLRGELGLELPIQQWLLQPAAPPASCPPAQHALSTPPQAPSPPKAPRRSAASPTAPESPRSPPHS